MDPLKHLNMENCMKVEFLTKAQIEEGLPQVLDSPRGEGKLEAIFARPAVDERRSLEEASLSPESGLEGDRWISSGGDSGPDPRGQLSLMNARFLDLVAGGDKERWELAGDNLIVDLDLSEEEMPAGQRLAVGEALLEVSDLPHTGCAKFVERYGKDAAVFVNATEHKDSHLRGILVRVIEGGQIRVGDSIRRV